MANASFTAPMVATSEVLLFRLTVTDDDGAVGSDTVTVTVNNVPCHHHQIRYRLLMRALDQIVDEGATVNLVGVGADSDGTIAAYSWQQVSGPSVAITNADMANASFTAPMVGAIQDQVFRLTVTDDDGATGSDTVTVTVNDVPAPPPPNSAPTVNAGANQNADEGTTVNLVGIGADSDGTIATYNGSKTVERLSLL